MSTAHESVLFLFGYRPKPRINGRPRRDLRGTVKGQLRVMRRLPNGADGCTRWLCACDCGRMTTVRTDHLLGTRPTSCGQCNGYAWKWWQ